MSDRPGYEAWFRRSDRFRLGAQSVAGWIVMVIFVVGLVAMTAGLTWATASGAFMQQARTVPRAGAAHVVRTHGWGGYYLRSGRSHFGGGSRVH